MIEEMYMCCQGPACAGTLLKTCSTEHFNPNYARQVANGNLQEPAKAAEADLNSVDAKYVPRLMILCIRNNLV